MADLKSWNLWHGCRKYSEGCANCSMFVLDKAHKVPESSTAVVRYYAGRLNVSPKYLYSTVKRVTGHSVSSYIDRYTVPIVKDYLADERLSLSQIAERMNFTSLSYFSRYCSKHLGQSPSEYRLSLQPKQRSVAAPGKE